LIYDPVSIGEMEPSSKDVEICGLVLLLKNGSSSPDIIVHESSNSIPQGPKLKKESAKMAALRHASSSTGIPTDMLHLEKEFRFQKSGTIIFLGWVSASRETLHINTGWTWKPLKSVELVAQGLLEEIMKILKTEGEGKKEVDKASNSSIEAPNKFERKSPISTEDTNLDVTRFVVHCKKGRYDVYIGRANPSIKSDYKWGNPFKIPRDGNREEVIKKYTDWIYKQPDLLHMARDELKGKILACWCAPEACHGHVLARIANSNGPLPPRIQNLKEPRTDGTQTAQRV